MCAYHLLQERDIVIEVYDQSEIPNPTSASCGKHRLIHPWSKDNNILTAQKALVALKLWQDILDDIGSDGFAQTGVLTLNDGSADNKTIPNLAINIVPPKDTINLFPFVRGSSYKNAFYFPQFGVLFAQQILIDMVKYLRNNGVKFKENHAAVSFNPSSGAVIFCDGDTVYGDKIILSAGYGSNALIKSSLSFNAHPDLNFQPYRCYVVYAEHPKINNNKIIPAWASLGKGDMWGMPPLKGIPMKLGNGDFTRPCNPYEKDDSEYIAHKVIEHYIQNFPQFKGLKIKGFGYNHWAKISNTSDYTTVKNAIIVTSDNGSGFKFAPYTAVNIVSSIQGI